MTEDADRRIGVVVAAYNAAKWIEATLNSLRQQTWTDWECIVIDDGSSDTTADLVHQLAESDGRIRLICQANAGLPTSRNRGIAALSDCAYVAFLDSDDLLEPNAFEVLATALAVRPDAVGAYGLAEYIDENGELLQPGLHPARQRRRHVVRGWRLRLLPVRADSTFADMAVYGAIWPPAVALQRLSEVRAVAGFDASYSSQEDWDFYLRLTRHGPYVATDHQVALYRRHGSNMTADHELSVFQQERVRHNAYICADNSPEQRRQVAHSWRVLEGRQAAVLLRHAARCLAAGRPGDAGSAALGTLICLAELLLPGPPRASARRVRFTRPLHHPGAVLIPE